MWFRAIEQTHLLIIETKQGLQTDKLVSWKPLELNFYVLYNG